MTADIGVEAIGLDDHRHGVPAHVTFDAPFDFPIARVRRLLLRGNGIDVRRADPVRNLEPGVTQPVIEFFEQQRGLLRLFVFKNILKNELKRR